MGKLLNKKTIPWVVICSAVVIFVYEVLYVVNEFDRGAEAILLIPSLFWVLATMGLIVWGFLKDKDNYLTLGILLILSILTGAFGSGFNGIYRTFAYNYFDSLMTEMEYYGASILVSGVASLCVAAAFILWALDKFFNIKVKSKDMITDILAIAACVLYIVSLVFMILSNGEYFDIKVVEYFRIASDVAYVLIFTCLIYKNKENSAN